VRSAAAGEDVRDRAGALEEMLGAYCGLDPDDDLDVGDTADFDGAFLGCCAALLHEYAGEGAPYSAARDVANAAEAAIDPEVEAENLRMLLRFLQHIPPRVPAGVGGVGK